MNAAVPVVDWAHFREMVDGDEAILRELVATFLDEAPAIMPALRAAIAAQNSRELLKAASWLKSLYLFVPQADGDAVSELNRKGWRGDTTGTDPLVADVQRQLDAVVQELTAYLAAGEQQLSPPM